MDTYCGKQCEYCVEKDALGCTGCKAVPGEERQKDCEICACCRSKEYDSCAQCRMTVGCGRQLGKNAMPARRRQKMEEAAAYRATMSRKSAAMAEWLILLFWLVLPVTVTAGLSGDFMAGALPGLLLPCLFLRLVLTAVYSAILLRLSVMERRYLLAGLCGLANVALTLAYSFTPVEQTGLSALLTVALLAAVMGAENREYNAHCFVLQELDGQLVRRWRLLWKWFATAQLGNLAGLVIIGIVPLAGGTVIILSLVLSLGVGVGKVLLLRRTIIALRECGELLSANE